MGSRGREQNGGTGAPSLIRGLLNEWRTSDEPVTWSSTTLGGISPIISKQISPVGYMYKHGLPQYIHKSDTIHLIIQLSTKC